MTSALSHQPAGPFSFVEPYGFRRLLRLAVIVARRWRNCRSTPFSCIHSDHRLTHGAELLDETSQVPELRIPIRVIAAFGGFAGRLQAIPHDSESVSLVMVSSFSRGPRARWPLVCRACPTHVIDGRQAVGNGHRAGGYKLAVSCCAARLIQRQGRTRNAQEPGWRTALTSQ
jgi:hypothetical protein